MKKHSQKVNGFSLVEVAMALGVASFCLVTLTALIPVGIQQYQKAETQTTMVDLATMVAQDLQMTPPGTTPQKSPRFQFTVPPVGGANSMSTPVSSIFVTASGSVTTAGTATAVYRISVGFQPPTAGRGATTARVQITWPGQADASTTGWSTKYSNSLPLIISLNPN